MSAVVPIIVVAIIVIQIFFFVKNARRMREYKQIFDEEKSWGIAHNQESGFVSGIYGRGNSVFLSIKDSINKYLGNNSGSVIDFQLLKDAVDRHCDSVENDINTLTPVPLYCGLVGTMAGVICGLFPLLLSGALIYLLSGTIPPDQTKVQMDLMAANGINELLSGVAWAMLASICGIILTTLSSILFKRYKLCGEAEKNTFLAWLQAKLLPELPSDTSDALNKLVKNLNHFNSTFSQNTTELRGALSSVNESYRIQADIIKAVHDMDVMKMAKANVNVLRELKECTDKLEQFNEYLNDIHGYTDAIHTFTTQFEQEANRLHVLEEIQQYFMRHKAEIAKDSADVDVALRKALKTINESASTSASELSKTLIEQSEQFKRIVNDEKETFEQISNDIKNQFSTQLNQIPMLEKKLGEISEIPAKLDKLISRIESSNSSLSSSVSLTMRNTAKEILSHAYNNGGNGSTPTIIVFPSWMRWTIVVSIILIAVACISSSLHSIFYSENRQVQESDNSTEILADSIAANDTTVVMPPDSI